MVASLTAVTASAWLLIASVAAGGDNAAFVSGSTSDLEGRMDIISADGSVPQPNHNIVVRRQTPSDVVMNKDGTLNLTAWDATVTAACSAALEKLSVSSNPSGVCTCYNLPLLDNTTGTFEADLRLYTISAATGDFEGIMPQDIQVGLSYNGASVTPIKAANDAVQKSNVSTAARQNEATSGSSSSSSSSSSTLKLLQSYLFVGQINKERMSDKMNSAQLEALVMPTVTLSGVNSAGKRVSTDVSSNEAAFVAGMFSKDVVLSDFGRAQQAVANIVTRLHNFPNDTVAFVLPGVQIMILPIGLIVTSVWLVVGLAVIGYGTFERISYREQFKRRLARAAKQAHTTF